MNDGIQAMLQLLKKGKRTQLPWNTTAPWQWIGGHCRRTTMQKTYIIAWDISDGAPQMRCMGFRSTKPTHKTTWWEDEQDGPTNFRVAVICIPENNTQNIPVFFLFVFFLVCEIYVRVTKRGTQDAFHSCGVWLITGIDVHLRQASIGWVMGSVLILGGYMHIKRCLLLM